MSDASEVSALTIVGASLAGLRGAEALRRDGFAGRIHLVGEEPHRPYDRPPLSKQYLSGEWDDDRLGLAPDDTFDALDLTLHLGRRAESLDVDNRSVTLEDGTVVAADGVMIATGARARTLPVPHRSGMHVLRTLDDSTALRSELAGDPVNVVVVGAGFIGAEVAATARERGHNVTMIEAAEAPMIRGLGVELGMLCAEIHRGHGVDVRLGVGVDEVVGDGRVEAVLLADGTRVACDVLVVGIGVIPNTEWLDGSGLTIDNGVVADETCLAAPGITVAGDVARWPNQLFDEVMRVEHWDNAVDQGVYAARRLIADTPPEPFMPVPWFWSDQFDRKIQLAGRSAPGDDVALATGSEEERRFARIFGRDGRIVGVFGMNRPRHVMKYRRMIASRTSWDDALAVVAEEQSAAS